MLFIQPTEKLKIVQTLFSFICLPSAFCQCSCKLPLKDAKKKRSLCAPLWHNQVTANCVCVRVFKCVSLVYACLFELWLSDFGDYGIRPQMSRADPKSNTHRWPLTTHTCTHTRVCGHAHTHTHTQSFPGHKQCQPRLTHQRPYSPIAIQSHTSEYTQIRRMIVLACIIKQDDWTIPHQRTVPLWKH